MKTSFIALLAIVSASLSPVALGQKKAVEKKPDSESPAGNAEAPALASESEFLQRAAAGGKGEVSLAELASKQAESAAVKALSQKLIKDHTAANKEVEALAQKQNVKLQEAPEEKMQKAFATLSTLSGKEFDAAYLKEMEHCHAHDIAMFEAAARISKGEVKAFITKTLPTLKAHAKEITKAKGARPGGAKEGR